MLGATLSAVEGRELIIGAILSAVEGRKLNLGASLSAVEGRELTAFFVVDSFALLWLKEKHLSYTKQSKA